MAYFLDSSALVKYYVTSHEVFRAHCDAEKVDSAFPPEI
jgi:hypothetical protein